MQSNANQSNTKQCKLCKANLTKAKQNIAKQCKSKLSNVMQSNSKQLVCSFLGSVQVAHAFLLPMVMNTSPFVPLIRHMGNGETQHVQQSTETRAAAKSAPSAPSGVSKPASSHSSSSENLIPLLLDDTDKTSRALCKR